MRIALPLAHTSRRPARLSLSTLLTLWRSRRALAQLSQEQLRDVGLSQDQANHESQRPLWDAPASWID